MPWHTVRNMTCLSCWFGITGTHFTTSVVWMGTMMVPTYCLSTRLDMERWHRTLEIGWYGRVNDYLNDKSFDRQDISHIRVLTALLLKGFTLASPLGLRRIFAENLEFTVCLPSPTTASRKSNKWTYNRSYLLLELSKLTYFLHRYQWKQYYKAAACSGAHEHICRGSITLLAH